MFNVRAKDNDMSSPRKLDKITVIGPKIELHPLPARETCDVRRAATPLSALAHQQLATLGNIARRRRQLQITAGERRTLAEIYAEKSIEQ